MISKESIVAYPHEIKFIDKNGSAISYYVDRKVSDYVKELQDKLSKIENENRQKDIDNLQLQSNWNSLREWVEKEIDFQSKIGRTCINGMTFIGQNETVYKGVLDKMNELEGREDEKI